MKDIMQALETQQQAFLPQACVCVCVCLQETVYIQIQKEGSFRPAGIPAWQLLQLVRVGVEGETDRNLAFFSACAAFIFFTSSPSASAYANQISSAPCAFPKYPPKKSTYVSAKWVCIHIACMHMRISNDDPLEVEDRNVCQFFPGVQSSEKLRD